MFVKLNEREAQSVMDAMSMAVSATQHIANDVNAEQFPPAAVREVQEKHEWWKEIARRIATSQTIKDGITGESLDGSQ